MRRDRLLVAINEAARFLVKAQLVLSGPLEDKDKDKTGCWPHVTVAACKRSSMDLTRALADLRRDDYAAGPK